MTKHHYECENGHRLAMNQPIDVCRVLRCETKLKAVGPGSRAKNRRLSEPHEEEAK